MTTASKARVKGEHLTNIDIAKILGLDKADQSQREIVKHMKCSQKAVQNMLANYQSGYLRHTLQRSSS